MSIPLTTEIELLKAQQLSASANGPQQDVRALAGKMKVILSSSAGSGTTPTLDVKLQDSDDGTTWTDVPGATFTQVTDTAGAFEAIFVEADGLKRYVRAVATLGGTSPVFDVAVIAIGTKQYAP